MTSSMPMTATTRLSRSSSNKSGPERRANMRFDGKVVLVTGGNSGIGRGIVHRVAAEGAAVALVGRNTEKGAAVEKEVAGTGARGRFFACDVASEEGVKALIEGVVRHFGRLDIVINNAGLGSLRA